jgi:hypothetical protein
MHPQILIMGHGHLASFITHEFNHKRYDFELMATYRNPEKIACLKLAGIHFFKYDSLVNKIEPQLYEANIRWVIWNFPPINNYSQILRQFNQLQHENSNWIFISSTGIYRADNKNRDTLIDCENFLTNIKRKVTILRPAGLIDHLRHPIFTLCKIGNVKAALSPVNLVHTSDVAKAIWHVINNNLTNQQYDLVADQHPSKRDYYSFMAKKLSLNLPQFNDENSSQQVISNQKFKQTGFNFKDIFILDS